ncbi:MAG: phenylalanine--tRNA ligase subunit beta [Acidobacteriota bacterium]
MKLPIDWLQEFVDVPRDAGLVAARLGSCGFAVDSIDGDVIDFEITANRPDCMSVMGLAREAATAFGLDLLRGRRLVPALPSGQTPVKASVGDAGCGRYALIVMDVTVGPSPAWLAARLAAAGVRPINNIVDVTNYVMLETGHPLHAFDAARLAGSEIRVRRARPEEPLTTLDNETRTLDDGMIVIADRDRAIAVAGVMGGAASEVSASTTRVALESAWFLPQSVRATSRRLGLKTEASMRFERGTDLAAPVTALARAAALIAEIGAGRLVGGVTDVFPKPVATRRIALRRARVAQVLGDLVPDAEVGRILKALAFTLNVRPDGWEVDVPSFRVDITREADLIEEIGRHWGLDRIPATFPALRTLPRPSAPGVGLGRLIRRRLCGAGLQEANTFTFMETAAAAPFSTPGDLVAITNPLSEKFAVLRPSLVPGLLESLTYNRNRQATDVRLFELGPVFSRAAGERTCVGWAISGSRGDHWSQPGAELTFADTKGIAEFVAETFGVTLEVAAADDASWLTRGQRASLLIAGQPAGWMGRLATIPSTDDPVFVGELDLAPLMRLASTTPTAIRALPRYPFVVRDLSILIDERLPAADVRGTIRSSAPDTLVSVREFDRYHGKGVPEGQISLSIRLTFQHADRTLMDAEVQQAVEAIVHALTTHHQATLRGR